MIQYIEANLFNTDFSKGQHTIAHIVNNKKRWGAGFVLPLAAKFPAAKKDYLEQKMQLGDVLYTIIDKTNVAVANMCAQTLGGKRPLYYNHLVHCMEDVASFAISDTIHCPLFGAGLAGGNWAFIHELIKDIWTNNNVNIYWLPNMLPDSMKQYNIQFLINDLK
jgi:hypothetical protein